MTDHDRTNPAASLFTVSAEVQPQWIDYNGHMNMGYYVVAFDELSTDAWFTSLDIGAEHFKRCNNSTFTLGCNIDYLREVFAGDRLRLTTQLIDYDHKRLHYYHCMYNEDKDYLAATNECLTLYVDMETRRSTSFDPDYMQRFEQELQRGQAHGMPAGFGRKLGIRRSS